MVSKETPSTFDYQAGSLSHWATIVTDAGNNKIGLVAGWGTFPISVAQTLVDRGMEVHCCAIRDHADQRLKEICSSYRVFGMGRMGGQAKFLRSKGVQSATMAGKIFKTMLFRKSWNLLWHLPDLAFLKHFYPIYATRTKDRKDDTLLLTVIDLYEAHGIKFAPATDFVPELLAPEGVLTQARPNARGLKDIEFGWDIAKEMGRLDIGQTVVVKNQAVMAVEAIEGTDACIRRAGTLCDGGFTVVKVAKPEQDMRFDVPTIGEGTIRTIHEAGGKQLAIEAKRTILLDAEATIHLANQLGVTIVAVERNETI